MTTMKSEYYVSEPYPEQLQEEITLQKPTAIDGLTIFKIIFELCAAVFLIVILYILLSGNIKAVQTACNGLWAILLCRVIMSAFTGIILTFGTWWYPEYMKKWWWHVLFLVYFLIFGVAELAVIPSAVIGNSLCIDTLANNSPTGTPILSVLGWIMIGMDWSVIIVMGCAVVVTQAAASQSLDSFNQADHLV